MDTRGPAYLTIGDMNTEEFWLLVQHLTVPPADSRQAAATLLSALTALDEQELAEFERHFQSQVDALDTTELRDVAGQLWVLNDEDWRNLRAWCVCRGPVAVDRLIHDASWLRRIAPDGESPFDAPSGELFLYCADYARVNRAAATGG